MQADRTTTPAVRRIAIAALTSVARRPGLAMASVGAACAVAYLLSLWLIPKADGRVVVGDAVHYFVYLRSLVFDRDLHFQNEYIRLYRLTLPPPPDTEWVFTPLATGYTRNVMPIGTALVWMPLYLAAAGAAWIAHALGLGAAPDGYSRALQATTALSGIAAATLGAWSAYRAAERLTSRESAAWAALSTWLASSAIYYSLVSPTYSHASSMLATSLVTWAWIATSGETGLRRDALVGALVGFAALVRVQDAVFLVLPLVGAVADARRDGRWGAALVRLSVAGAAAAVVFSPQVIVWSRIYGAFLLVPQGSGFMRWTEPHLADVLVSTYRGLFTWTPILLVATAGLVPLARRHGRVACGLILVLALSWYVNAAVADWWAGEAFGARRFVSCFPIFVAGLAAVLDSLREAPLRRLGGVVVFVSLNFLLLFQYQLFLKGLRDIAPYPDDLWALWLARFVVPFRALGRALGG